MGAPNALEIRGLTKRFGGLVALHGVDLTMKPGEMLAVIGPNGAGKTTFFNVVRGWLTPTAGQISFQGRRITGLPVHAVSRLGIASTLQVTGLFAGLPVWENLLAAAQSRVPFLRLVNPFSRFRDREARVEEILALLDLEARAAVPAGNLSHGEQRLLEIGVALATDPLLLLLDEPTAGMSPHETQRTVDIVKKVSRAVDVLLVEHDMDVVMELADRIVVLDQGRILCEGSPDAIQANAMVQEVYLGAGIPSGPEGN